MTTKKQPEKICRIVNSDGDYSWDTHNRPGARGNINNQCIMAVVLGRSTCLPCSEYFKLTGGQMSERQEEAISSLDDGSGNAEDVMAIRRIGTAVGVKVEVIREQP
jgi:hypothetical protein